MVLEIMKLHVFWDIEYLIWKKWEVKLILQILGIEIIQTLIS